MRFNFIHSKTGQKCCATLECRLNSLGILRMRTPQQTAIKHKLDTFKVVGLRIYRNAPSKLELAEIIIQRVVDFLDNADESTPSAELLRQLQLIANPKSKLLRASAEEQKEYHRLHSLMSVHAERQYDNELRVKNANRKRRDAYDAKKLAAARALILKADAIADTGR